MKQSGWWITAACVVALGPLVPALAGPMQGGGAAAQNLPAGEGKDVLLKNCVGCHAVTMITSQHKSESEWTDTVIEMRNRGANGTDDEMEKIVHYLTANFGPAGSAPASKAGAAAGGAAAAQASTPGAAMTLPPKKPQATPQQVIDEHVAAMNTCDWNRLMAQYDDDMRFLSKDGAVVQGREAIGAMFKNALQPPPVGICGMKMSAEKTFVVGDTVNVVWRMDAPFFAEPYRGSEAFETHNGMLVLQVTTYDPAAIKMKK